MTGSPTLSPLTRSTPASCLQTLGVRPVRAGLSAVSHTLNSLPPAQQPAAHHPAQPWIWLSFRVASDLAVSERPDGPVFPGAVLGRQQVHDRSTSNPCTMRRWTRTVVEASQFGAHALSHPRGVRWSSVDTDARSGTQGANSSTSDPSRMHNTSIDEDAVREGGCAQVHLPTGGMCTLRHGHEGSCEFIAAEAADASLAQHKADEGW